MNWRLIAVQRESVNLEYKETVTNTFLKTVSAFANYGSGDIIFGIADDGEKKGVADPVKSCLDIENRINDNISPVPKYWLSVQQGNLIDLHVEEGRSKPYTYKNKAYRRSDSASVPIDRLEYNRLVLIGINKNFEDLPAFNQDLHFSVLEKHLMEKLGIEKITTDILKTLQLYSKKNGYNRAAEMLADVNSFHGTDIVRFGKTINQMMERETTEEKSVLTQYDNAVHMFRRYYQYESIEGVERKTKYLIPEEAFREALANALVHRRWDIPADINISMFEDRIEISSPGGLPEGVTEEEYLHNQISVLRNPIVASIFFRLDLIESFGTGIQRIRETYSESVLKPEFYVYANSLRVVLPTLKETEVLTGDEETVLNVMNKNIWLSRENIDERAGFSKDHTIRVLNSLLEKHLIGKSGRGRGTKYKRA